MAFRVASLFPWIIGGGLRFRSQVAGLRDTERRSGYCPNFNPGETCELHFPVESFQALSIPFHYAFISAKCRYYATTGPAHSERNEAHVDRRTSISLA